MAALDGDLKAHLNAAQNAVLLSKDTLIKQRRHHPELTDKEYRLLPDLVNKGAVIDLGNGQRLAFFHQAGRLYKAALKATRAGDELYLLSFYRANKNELARDKRRGTVIREEK